MRDDFPILQREINGYPLVYFDNAATTQKPNSVIDAMNDYYSNSNANVHRAVHTLAGEATEGYESCRRELKSRFNASKAIITSGTTEAINLVAHAWGRANLSDGDAIILTEMEHHSDIVPWQMLAKEMNIELRYVPVQKDLTLDMDLFEDAIEGAKLVCVVHISNVLGVCNPVEKIIEIAKKKGARVLLDAAQSAPHQEIDFQQLGADFMAFSAHKMCGPTGIGSLLVSEDAFAEMQPFMGGGDMIETVSIHGSTYQKNEQKFEAGTPRIAEAIGWSEAIKWLNSIDIKSEHKRILHSARWLAVQLREMGMTVYGRHDDNDAAVVSFLHPTMNSEDLAHLLDARGFAVRTGHHCAQPLLDRLEITGTVRVSLYFYNTHEEVVSFVDYLKEILERFA
ncbi:MAG TPA: SufS family cysteine desulfurase [Candidatus Poseidoniaceae archaeon]|nr:MAG TPA: SufS family cysteine desulfurase [Candidatus Poseidoniales archaeon]DAC59688.1 MAG TPA: SufS family cysteine desulfurase [Candidatus Poseidoniales archaeon]HII23603.1 SufS family cysteine desulfurase [Candidatus Poseidoniaceae archaeon]HII50403.1 SufS family cysteine desulfurase [Candidatus Poseidoniaceae archaeon]|tara:strand:- start:1276 stop:2463 length:1188 start_codon:yes stop_codon:yes gene_type:complete